MERPTPNVPLLRQTLAHIEQHPETWNQESWRAVWPCGTTMCFAGTACVLAGGVWLPGNDGPYLLAEHDDPDGYRFTHSGEKVVAVNWRARRVLGLRGWQAAWLFDAGNDLDDLRRIVGRICDEAEAVES